MGGLYFGACMLHQLLVVYIHDSKDMGIKYPSFLDHLSNVTTHLIATRFILLSKPKFVMFPPCFLCAEEE